MKKKINVMVAEDLDIIRENLVDKLSQDEEIEVIGEARSGKEIVQLVLESEIKPDVVLVDIEMETRNAGIEAANEINQHFDRIKIIFSTIHEDDHTVIDAMSTGAVDYVIKEANCENTIEHIKRAYNNQIIFDRTIQKIMHNEFKKLVKSKEDNINFMKKIMILTPSEREIINLLLEGKKTAEIADARFVELVTIKKQIGKMLKKFNCKRTKEIVFMIRELQIENLFKEE